MAYRSGPANYLIRDPLPKKEDNQDQDEESERIEVDDEEGDFVSGSNERREEMGERGYKKKYTFTQRKAATLYHCEECNKTFKHPSKIAEHMRKHTRERPYLCEVCGARFTQGGSLKVHLRAHLGELPYKCSYCDRHFATPYNQRAHEAVHIRGGRLHRDHNHRLMNKEGEARQKMVATSAALANQKSGGEMEGELFECGVDNCGYQHEIRLMVENHVMTQHAELWEGQELEGVEGEEVIEGEGEETSEYQNYAYYEYMDDEILMDEQQVVVMTEEEVAAVTAANAAAAVDGGDEHISSHSPPLDSRLSLLPSMGIHATVAHPSTSNGGNSLVIEADEQIDDESIDKSMSEDGRTKRLRMLTLGRTGMVKEEMYPEVAYSPDAPLATYEVEVMTSREGNAIASAVVSSTMEEEDDEMQQPVYSEMTRAQIIHEMEDDGGDHVRVIDATRALKGRRPMHKWEDEMEGVEGVEGVEADVDSEYLEEVNYHTMPQQPPRGMNSKRKKRSGPPIQSRNLDWIINAVAQGQDVDSMSPHNRKKPTIHTCQYCGKTDKYPSKIQAHMRTHTGEKPYKCEFCGMGFAQKTPLRMHIRRHLNDRNFGCDVAGCGAKFISQALLNAHHSSRHLHTKRFVCMKGCGRWFANGRNQRQHEIKCNHIINRTTVNTDYGSLDVMEDEVRYDVDATEEDEGGYMEEEEDVGADEEDEYEGEETLHLGVHGGHSDMNNIQPEYL